MAADADRARRVAAPHLRAGIEIVDAEVERAESPDVDAFGNEGLSVVETFRATGRSPLDREAIADAYRAEGWRELPGDSWRDDDRIRFRREDLDPSNPFLRQNEVEVGIGGRDLGATQRKALAARAEALRAELARAGLPDGRRRSAGAMLAEIETGLMPRATIVVTRRIFEPAPLHSADGLLGELAPLSRGRQIVYSVAPADPADREDEAETEPMYMTVLGVGEDRLTLLLTGGVHGQRTLTGLNDGAAHHAWFRNRVADETEDTAPFLSRRIARELRETGESALIVRRERDETPVRVVRKGEGHAVLRVDGADRSVPVLLAETEKEDRLTVLADPAAPLVLSLFESGADLLRTVDEIRTLPL